MAKVKISDKESLIDTENEKVYEIIAQGFIEPSEELMSLSLCSKSATRSYYLQASQGATSPKV